MSIQALHQILVFISGLHVRKERFDAHSMSLFGCILRDFSEFSRVFLDAFSEAATCLNLCIVCDA